MGIISALFKKNRRKAINIHEEINLTEAINGHMKWRGRLQSCLDGTSNEKLDPVLICRDDQCALGQWMHGPALVHFQGDTEFERMRTDHAQLHFLTSYVLHKIQQNDHASAKMLFNGEYLQVSHKVINALGKLNDNLVKAGHKR